MRTKLIFENPFGDPNDDHETPDPLCLARVNFDLPMASTIEEFYVTAMLAIDNNLGQAAFFNIRQLAELSLKALFGPTYQDDRKLRFCHDLDELLAALGPGHDLVTQDDEDQDVIVGFIRKIAEIDPKGDEGRYPLTGGQPSLSRVCHAEKDKLRLYTGVLYEYVSKRVTW
ncbi:hypothetical protein [Catellatospora sp. NPDC049609]|uniref:hypothetical protein n=1 Tax=Catellatospora sp. NPDC049609 TaxID=3155505 RepID=UPI00343ADA10